MQNNNTYNDSTLIPSNCQFSDSPDRIQLASDTPLVRVPSETNQASTTLPTASTNQNPSQLSIVNNLAVNPGQINSSTWKTTLKVLNTLSFLLNPLFSVYLFGSIIKANKFILSEVDMLNSWLETFLTGAAILFSGIFAIQDQLTINPMETAERLCSATKNTTEEANPCVQKTSQVVAWTNQFIAFLSYTINAGSSALGLAYFLSNVYARWITAIPAIILGVLFYNMVTGKKIDEHSFKFVKNLFNFHLASCLNIFRSPIKWLEALLQIIFNVAFRGIACGYTMQQLLVNFFGQTEASDESTNWCYIITAFILTVETALFSRVENVYKSIFAYERATPEELAATKISLPVALFDVFTTSLRAVSLGFLICPFVGYFFGIGASVALALSGILVRVEIHHNQAAVAARKNEQNRTVQTVSEQNFDDLVDKFRTPSLKTVVTTLNFLSRFARLYSLLGFVTTLHGAMNLALSNTNLIFLTLLCGISFCENDFSFSQELLETNTAYYRAKYSLGFWSWFKTSKELSEKEPNNITHTLDNKPSENEALGNENVNDSRVMAPIPV